MHIVEFLGRALLSTLFLIEGIGKISMQEEVIMFMDDYGVPGNIICSCNNYRNFISSIAHNWL